MKILLKKGQFFLKKKLEFYTQIELREKIFNNI